MKNVETSFTTHAILSSLDYTKENGDLFVFVPDTFLFHRKLNLNIRELHLVLNKLIVSIISLPADLLKPYSRNIKYP